MESFNASIVVLKTGTQLICDLKEIFDGEGDDKKGVCLLMIHPYELSLVPPKSKSTKQDLQVKFSKWCPYSTDYQYKIPYDSVMAIGAPEPGLEQAYKIKIAQIIETVDQNTISSQEQIEQFIDPEVMPNE